MSERDTNSSGIQINAPLGLNQRAAPNALPAGEWALLEGCYPAQAGLLERIPGKELYLKLTSPIWNIHQTNDGSGNIIIQTRDDLRVYTLDELLGRETTPSLTYTDGGGENPGDDTTEETMSMAILVQKEGNNTSGGSLRGIQSGSDATALANTFYTRRLTDILINEASTVVSTSLSTATGVNNGSFTLSPGSYRITANLTYCNTANTAGFCVGLYNVTDGAFEVHSGGTTPILATAVSSTGASNTNLTCVIDTAFEVTSSNKTFEIRHKSSSQAAARELTACGRTDAMTTANVNGAAAPQFYAYVKILKTA